jgi:DNA-binding FrmR family transcriptional regulator
MTPDARAKVDARLSRIAGQVAGLQKMVRDERYCVDILTQVAAIRSALDAVGVELLTSHLETCVAGCHSGEDGQNALDGRPGAHPHAKTKTPDELLDEVRLTLSRFLR